jgi:hypothetical protein
MEASVGTAGAPRRDKRRSAVWDFISVWAQAWFLIAVGGGACGLVLVGVVSIIFFFLTIPGGLYLGALLGGPLGLVLAIGFARYASPSTKADVFARRVERVGAVIAVAVVASANVYVVRAVILSGTEQAALIATGAVLNGIAASAASALVGRECGHVLAQTQLERYDLAVPGRHPVPGLGWIDRAVSSRWARTRQTRR